MPARRPLPEDTAERLKAAMKKAKTRDEYRRMLCVWLRHVLGLNSAQISAALLWSASQVRLVQARYLREGEAAFASEPGRGGRRRCLLSDHDEGTLLCRLREEAFPSNVVDYRTVHRAVEKAVGRPVDPAAVHRMLTRHGWGRHALVTIPHQKLLAHLPTGKEEIPGEAHRSGLWQLLRDDPEEWKPILQRIQERIQGVKVSPQK